MNGEVFNLLVGWSLLLFLIGYLLFPILKQIGHALAYSMQKRHWRREFRKCLVDNYYFYRKYWKHVEDPVSIQEFFKDKV